ncbi:hypothetical protein [Streptosporangium vulgare]|uniref:Uncharacterized protein n=1 Tax=Streptosporangium vulgare TaxID=46190 RepID=A0ABV5TRG2_9ACTN
MPFEFLSDEQVARYGRFPAEPSMAELEQAARVWASGGRCSIGRGRTC